MSDRLFLGIDLAWVSKNRTGMALVDDDGRLLSSGSVGSDDDIADWIGRHTGRVVVAAVDAPLIVPNDTGRRLGEARIAEAYGRYSAGPYSSSKAIPYFNPPRAETLASRFGWTMTPENRGSVAIPACIEVYPHPAMVGLFSLGERILYKKGPRRAEGFAQLVSHFETLTQLDLTSNARWLELRKIVSAPQPGDLNRIEDELDAILCAHLAWLWHHDLAALEVYGTLEDGYIVAPPAPTHAAVRSAPIEPGPTPWTLELRGVQPGTSATIRGSAWRAAIEEACNGTEVYHQGERLELEVHFTVPQRLSSNDEWDLDNLLKPTIDGLSSLLGVRRGNHSVPQADEERIDRIIASKRAAQGDEQVGATLKLRRLNA